MSLLLDTHVWVRWIASPERLSKPARAAIDAAAESGDRLRVSCISTWEVSLLVAKGRLRLTIDAGAWIERAEAIPLLEFIPVDNRIAHWAVTLPPPLHADPADRIIAATAEVLGLRLVTADRRLREYGEIETVW